MSLKSPGPQSVTNNDNEAVHKALTSVRDRLLDLTLRNRLLNYRERATCIRVVDELPRPTFEMLSNGKSLEFAPLDPDLKSTPHQTELPPDQDPKHTAKRHRDAFLQTNLDSDRLDKRLKRVHREAKREMEETGANILYLAMGFLCWRDKDNKSYQAPLILAPVSLTRSRTRRNGRVVDRYQMVYDGEDLQTNRCLAQKLSREYNVILPELDEENLEPENYFTAVQEAITDLAGWSVAREMVLSFFSFAKLFMVLDLDPSTRAQPQSLVEHPVIRELLIGSDGRDRQAKQPRENQAEPPLILDADGTQIAAIQAALQGRNLVIEGPPGTGKSQTIANLIAAFLQAGKSVLFLAEKAAALEVVKRRLDGVGLGPFIMELHSHKTQKRALIEDLKGRLEHQEPQIPAAPMSRLAALHQGLNQFSTLMLRPHPPTGWTLFDIFWRYHKARDQEGDVEGLPLPGFAPAPPEKYARGRLLMSQIMGVMTGSSPMDHPWFGFDLSHYNLAHTATLADAVTQLAARLESMLRRLVVFQKAIEQPLPASLKHLFHLIQTPRDTLFSWPSPLHNNLLQACLDPHKNNHLKRLCQRLEQITSQRNQRAKKIIGLTQLDDQTLAMWINRMEPTQALGELTFEAARQVLRRATRLKTAAQRMDQSLAVNSWSHPMIGRSHQEIMAYQTWLESISEHPPECLELSPSHLFFKPEVRSLFKKAHIRFTALQKCRTELELTFHLDQIEDLEQLNAAVATLNKVDTQITRLFKPAWRAAAAATKRLFKQPVKNRREANGKLRRLVEHLWRERAFDTDAVFVQGLGNLFTGMNTDWFTLEKGFQWAEHIQNNASDPGLVAELELDTQGALNKIRRLQRELSQESSWFVEDLPLFPESDPATAPALCPAWRPEDPASELVKSLDHLIALLAPPLDQFEGRIASPGLRLKDLHSALVEERATLTLISQLEGVRLYRQLLGAEFRLQNVPKSLLQSHLKWADDLAETGLDNRLLRRLAQADTESRTALLWDLIEDLRDDYQKVKDQLHHFEPFGDNPVTLLEHPRRHKTTLPELVRRLKSPDIITAAAAWGDYTRFRQQARDFHLGPVIDAYEAGRIPTQRLVDRFERSYLESLALDILKTHPELNDINHQALAQFRREFADLDEQKRALDAVRIIQKLLVTKVPDGIGVGKVSERTEMGLIRREIAKSTRHVPIRSLIQRAGGALRALKPCFMMSPLSVAQYLPTEGLHFDLVIMDEASQLRPEECLGGIARATQVVVVGDPKQMPPTQFFDNQSVEDSESPTEDLESILDLFVQTRVPTRRLSWHYRARHEDLIRFSNHHFYQNGLTVFPSPNAKTPEQGVKVIQCEAGIFHKRVNAVEADLLAAKVIEHLRANPQQSLGVCCFNGPQRDLIEERIEAVAASSTRDLKLWQAACEGAEPLFVKNLENVQGDERDVMFISVTYGRDPETGRVYQRFGPLNQAVGGRRLNVMFTRARSRMVLFSSLKPEDIRVNANTNNGVRLLRDFLEFARDPDVLHRHPALKNQAEPSPFQTTVGSLLARLGYAYSLNVGGLDSPIDIAVHHPKKQGVYLLGIQSDGPSYGGTAQARDRERLLPTVLNGLGWRLYRITTLDWFKNREAEEKRLMHTLQACEAQ